MKKIILLVLLSIASVSVFAEQSIRLMTEEFSPYQYYEVDGEVRVLTGISMEIVRALQEKIGNSDPIKLYPWNRGLKVLNKHKNSALFSTVRTPGRESKYKWVGPLSKLEIVFFKRVDSDLKISSIDDAKMLTKIGVAKNVAAHEILLSMGFSNLDVMASGVDDKNLKRLIKGRIDAWPTAYFSGIYAAKKMGVHDQVEAIREVPIMLGDLYIAFNKETDDHIIHKWQSALDQLKSDGIIDEIIKKYDR